MFKFLHRLGSECYVNFMVILLKYFRAPILDLQMACKRTNLKRYPLTLLHSKSYYDTHDHEFKTY